MNYCMSGFPVLHYLQSLLKLMSNEFVMPPNHLILCCPLLLLPSIFLSIRVFPNEIRMLLAFPCAKWCIPWKDVVCLGVVLKTNRRMGRECCDRLFYQHGIVIQCRATRRSLKPAFHSLSPDQPWREKATIGGRSAVSLRARFDVIWF